MKLIKSVSKTKKVFMLLAVGILAISVLAGCGNKGDGKGDANAEQTITKVAGILGKDDAKVIAALGEGKGHKNADGTVVTNREYEMTLFGEETLVRVDYDEAGIASSGIVLLAGQDIAPYKAQMESIYGKGEVVEIPAEDGTSLGTTTYVWQVKKATVTLMLDYGISTIKIDSVK